MSRAASDPQAVLNAFLRQYLEDRERGEERSLEHYLALYPGHGELIGRELAALRAEAPIQAPDAEQAALGEFLRLFLEDQAAGRERALDEYQARFPGHEARIACEHELLRSTRAPTNASAATALGRTFGPYTLVRPLGRGGQGRVWLARDTRLARLVALKVLTELAAFSPLALERFRREAQIASRLSDPGICTVYETGTEEGIPYIAMRYVEGDTLATRLEEARNTGRPSLALPPEPGREEQEQGGGARIARLIERIARSLHEAHEMGIVHRDVKPGNVILGLDGLPVLVDFGLASVQDGELATLTRTGDALGTPAYMSPEQLTDGRRLDRRSDVYSLGVVLYECLTLHRPFEADSREALQRAILTNEPRDPRAYHPGLSEDIATILEVALEKDRERRYPTAAALAEDLRRCRAGEPILARAASQMYRMRKLVRRNRTLVASLSAIALVLSVATALVTRSLLRERARVAEVLRLSALQRLEDLATEADELWPPDPRNIARYEDWLRRTRELVAELPLHEASLAELRKRAVRGSVAAAAGSEELTFTSNEDRWWNNQLEKLVDGVAALSDPRTGLRAGTSPEHGWGIEPRLELARTIEERSVTGPEASARWRRAIESIASTAECPAYRGLRITPQLGLLPLGRNSTSGLWEFAHLPTGAACGRGPDGELAPTEESGLVFVLLSGGTFTMGAQANDPSGPNYCPVADQEEAPPHAVTLSPFFLSKYELTQAQWLRITGHNPSRYGPHNYYAEWDRDGAQKDLLLHPVEQVNWIEGTSVCRRLGLVLPSEAQWEYAARGGTDGIWWTGNERESLRGAANVLDDYAWVHGGEDWHDRSHDAWLDDGHTVHAPVGSYRANPFGLFDVVGNVWEWCRDSYDLDMSFYGESSGPDPVFEPAKAAVPIRRGGSFYNSSQDSRSATRGASAPGYVEPSVGLRPARAVQ